MIRWADAPTITTPDIYTEVAAQPCAYLLRRPRRRPESKRADGFNPALFTGSTVPASKTGHRSGRSAGAR